MSSETELATSVEVGQRESRITNKSPWKHQSVLFSQKKKNALVMKLACDSMRKALNLCIFTYKPLSNIEW